MTLAITVRALAARGLGVVWREQPSPGPATTAVVRILRDHLGPTEMIERQP